MNPDTVTTINGWITPRLERVLGRAAAISAEHQHNFLGIEHVALAMIEDGSSLPLSVWGERAVTTEQWREAILTALYPTGEDSPATAVRVETVRPE